MLERKSFPIWGGKFLPVLERVGRRGFTLVELLISLVILAILVSIAIPNYLKYKKNAIVSQVQGNLVSCAGELMAEFADEGTSQKVCTVPDSDDTCTLVVDQQSNQIKISTSYCIFNTKGVKVKCDIKTHFGDVNGRIDCSSID